MSATATASKVQAEDGTALKAGQRVKAIVEGNKMSRLYRVNTLGATLKECGLIEGWFEQGSGQFKESSKERHASQILAVVSETTPKVGSTRE